MKLARPKPADAVELALPGHGRRPGRAAAQGGFTLLELLVVIAIHDINLAIDWADRILCLQQGRVVSEGGVDVIDEALLERVFQIKTDRVEAAGRVWFMPSL